MRSGRPRDDADPHRPYPGGDAAGRLQEGPRRAHRAGRIGAEGGPFTGTVFLFRAKRADRLKILFWGGSGLVMAYKRLEEATFTWPGVRDGVMTLNRAQFEALFAGLDWRKVKALETQRPAAAE